MTKEQALHQFWSSFGLTAYDSNSVPDGAALPYITYDVSTSSGVENNTVYLSGSLWYNSTSWVEITNKSNSISQYLGEFGAVYPVDNGYVWIKKGSPFANRMSEPSNKNIRRININIEVDFNTKF